MSLNYLESSYLSFLSRLVAWSSAYHTFLQNFLFGGENKLIGAAPTKGNDTPMATMSYVYTIASVFVSNLVEQVFKYTNNDLQRAIKFVLELFC